MIRNAELMQYPIIIMTTTEQNIDQANSNTGTGIRS